jgi:hypothetical protein
VNILKGGREGERERELVVLFNERNNNSMFIYIYILKISFMARNAQVIRC